ncbi:hypothetical protein GMRT_13321 [Giardia muris]|uniref:Uncharacterized protein n=1 Tax=Giardia muris TaxID=5742 RepID=A0A4Z1SKU6_GIAMU|nr:hypothetical protein GMRT_13321 [Giardia muris]|eukprot:TNJ26284.1 hypothetical protein GMRT_13321 [Giardia muris]
MGFLDLLPIIARVVSVIPGEDGRELIICLTDGHGAFETIQAPAFTQSLLQVGQQIQVQSVDMETHPRPTLLTWKLAKDATPANRSQASTRRSRWDDDTPEHSCLGGEAQEQVHKATVLRGDLQLDSLGLANSLALGRSQRLAHSHLSVIEGVSYCIPLTPSLSLVQSAIGLPPNTQAAIVTLENQYTVLLEEAAEKLGEAAAMHYLHGHANAYRDIINLFEALQPVPGAYPNLVDRYKAWRVKIGQVRPDLHFLGNPLAIEYTAAFEKGFESQLIRLTKLALVRDGDHWYAISFIERLLTDCRRPELRSDILMIMGTFHLEKLQLSDQARLKAADLLAELSSSLEIN